MKENAQIEQLAYRTSLFYEKLCPRPYWLNVGLFYLSRIYYCLTSSLLEEMSLAGSCLA